MHLHLFRIEPSGCGNQIQYLYVVSKDQKMSKAIHQIRSYRKYVYKRYDLVFSYEYVGPVKVFDGLCTILNMKEEEGDYDDNFPVLI
jgi:hypothetical protein